MRNRCSSAVRGLKLDNSGRNSAVKLALIPGWVDVQVDSRSGVDGGRSAMMMSTGEDRES